MDLGLVPQKHERGHLYATPAYLEAIGNPTTLEALSNGEFIAVDKTNAFMDGLNAMGLRMTPRSFPWVSSNQQVQWALVTQGSGIGVMTEQIGDADRRVVRVLPELIAFPFPMWLTSHREVRTSSRVRVVFDMLATLLEQVSPTTKSNRREMRTESPEITTASRGRTRRRYGLRP